MHHLTPERIAELRKDLLSMRDRLIKQAKEQIMDHSDVTFQGMDEIESQRIRTKELKLLERLKARSVTTMCINCKELEEEGKNE